MVIRWTFLLLAACGGSGSHARPKEPDKTAVPEKPDPYMEWHKSQPKSPAEPVRTTRFEPPQQCGQGPYRFKVDSVSAPFSESVEVKFCVTKSFKGSVSYVAPGYSSKEEKGFGSTQDSHHDKCRVDATVVTSAGSTSTGGTAGKPATRGKATAAKSTTATTPVELKGELVATGSKCPAGTHEMSIMEHGYTADGWAPVKRGSFVIEVWSELPNDLKGASFLVEQRGVPAGYKIGDWRAYRQAYEAWYKRRDEALAASRAQGHTWTTVEPVAATPQPPPARAETQPPRPSTNASWTPGYWQFTDGWVWSAGFWRVPQKDIEQERTVEAPAPPPAPRVDPPPPTDVAYYSARRAVWTPGHWMWNGGGYVWIAGAWRIPDAAGMAWVAPSWRPTRRGTLMFVPGGFVRIQTRR